MKKVKKKEKKNEENRRKRKYKNNFYDYRACLRCSFSSFKQKFCFRLIMYLSIYS